MEISTDQPESVFIPEIFWMEPSRANRDMCTSSVTDYVRDPAFSRFTQPCRISFHGSETGTDVPFPHDFEILGKIAEGPRPFAAAKRSLPFSSLSSAFSTCFRCSAAELPLSTSDKKRQSPSDPSVSINAISMLHLMGKTGTDAVQKPRPVLSYHLEQCARGRAGIIKCNPRLYLHLGDRILVERCRSRSMRSKSALPA
jgi:hypothetical protein